MSRGKGFFLSRLAMPTFQEFCDLAKNEKSVVSATERANHELRQLMVLAALFPASRSSEGAKVMQHSDTRLVGKTMSLTYFVK